jgi:transposase
MLAERQILEKIVAVWDVSRQTISHWVKTLMYEGLDSLQYQKPKGQPAKLTKTQKDELYALVKSGPEACGFDSGCRTSVLIQELIRVKFGVLFNRFYVCELLRNIGISRQKARFVSDHLSEEKRKNWMETAWPKILEQAKVLRASLFFGEALATLATQSTEILNLMGVYTAGILFLTGKAPSCLGNRQFAIYAKQIITFLGGYLFE